MLYTSVVRPRRKAHTGYDLTTYLIIRDTFRIGTTPASSPYDVPPTNRAPNSACVSVTPTQDETGIGSGLCASVRSASCASALEVYRAGTY